jgi:hypothetical protein
MILEVNGPDIPSGDFFFLKFLGYFSSWQEMLSVAAYYWQSSV